MAVEVALNPGSFNCDSCKCDANHDAGYVRWRIPGVIETSKCPRWLITEESSRLLRLFGHYKNGHLVVAGGLMQQPNVYLEAMGVIDAHIGSRNDN